MAVQHRDQIEPREDLRAVTLRSVGFGLLLVAGFCLTGTYVKYFFHGSRMTISHLPMAMLMVFIVLIFATAIFSRLSGLVLRPAEWRTVLSMGFVGAMLPVNGVVGYLIGYISAPYFYATPENGWEKYLYPDMPTYLVPSNEGNAVSWFYQTLPVGASIPWGVWVLPIFWWTLAIMATFALLASAAVIFRKQWSENERLAFPAVAPFIDMVNRPGNGQGWLPEFTRNRLFWIGFAISFGMIAWNCIQYFSPDFPRFPIYRGRWYWIDRQFPPIRGYLGIFTLFFAYFASLDVLFSMWFFDLIFIFEGGWLNILGYKAISPYEPRGVYQWQMRGGFIVLVLSVFWVARGHLKDVFLKAIGKNNHIDDRHELMSYRTALLAFIGAAAYLFIWMSQMGFDPLHGIILLGVFIFVYVGLSKILAETGMPYAELPVGPWSLILPFFGNRGIDPITHVAQRFTDVLTGRGGRFLPAAMHATRISEGIDPDQRKPLMGALFLSVLFSFLFSVFITLRLGYLEGAINFGAFELPSGAAARLFKHTVNVLKKPNAPPFYEKEPAELIFFFLGGIIMTALIYLRHRLVWWPLHPVGLAISGTDIMRRVSFTIFLAWLIKLIVLKIGGPSVYRKSQPLFIGLLVGYVLGVVLSSFIDILWFAERGHPVHIKG